MLELPFPLVEMLLLPTSFAVSGPLLYIIFLSWLVAEILFAAVFYFVWLPKANQNRPAQPYRDPYHAHKHLLLRQLIDRIRDDIDDKESLHPVVTTFLQLWFRPRTNQLSIRTQHVPSLLTQNRLNQSTSDKNGMLSDAVCLVQQGSTLTAVTQQNSDCQETSSESSSMVSLNEDNVLFDDDSNDTIGHEYNDNTIIGDVALSSSSVWTIPGIHKRGMDAFLAWALFSKSLESMSCHDCEELERCYEVLRNELDLVFYEQDSGNKPDESSIELEPRLLSLDPLNALHRPLVVYVATFICRRLITDLLLRLAGFQRVQSSKTGLTGWYRAARRSSQQMPFLFFHGIAPGGLCFYLPMILSGLLGGDDRASFLFENNIIAGTCDFSALSETEVVIGVQEIVETYLPDLTSPLAVCGHSFGSCQLTWLLHSSTPDFRQRIRQYILLDPVTVLLSDPDVMVNFLSTKLSKIRLFASSELFTEYYLRKHFAWYNSELRLDEINHPDRQVLIVLSEQDEIVNAPKVKKHVDMFVQRKRSSNIRTLVFRDAKHARCVTSPRMWRAIRAHMLQGDLEIFQQTEHSN